MRCPVCQRENRGGATYCAACGARLPCTPDAEPFDVEPAQAAAAPTDGEPVGLPTVKLVQPRRPQADVGEGSPSAEQEAPDAPSGPLQEGQMVAGRFEILTLLETTPQYNRYRARDWGRCAACGYDDNARGDEFCLDCGASLSEPAYATLVELLRNPPEGYDLALRDREREYFVTLEDEEQPEEPPLPESNDAPLTLRWACACDPGLQRDHNEDYVDCWSYSHGRDRTLGLFVVADGLGGRDSGEVASRLATQTVWSALRERVWEPILHGDEIADEALEQACTDAAEEANCAVYEARLEANSEMSTTLTLALVVGRTAYIANVGDSRTYLFGAGGLQQVTVDHSLVRRLVDNGQLTPDQVYTHPQRNLIYQSIGDRPEVQVDCFRRRLEPGDRLLLCSDGLWEAVREEGISDVLMAESDPQRACDLLVSHANLAGGEDNISVIVVQALAV